MAYMTATGRDWQESERPGLRACAAYDGRSESIAAARGFSAGFLRRVDGTHGLRIPSRTLAETQLVVSELVTNACKYAPGPTVLSLEIRGPLLEIALWDTESALPIARAAEPGRIGQHGLEIVFALCEGFDVRREPLGKRIAVTLVLDRRGSQDDDSRRRSR
jgi:anti-sigma regulatory factor (Ser/Thr protein kinase)